MENKKVLLMITAILLLCAEILSAQSSETGTLNFRASGLQTGDTSVVSSGSDSYMALTADMTDYVMPSGVEPLQKMIGDYTLDDGSLIILSYLDVPPFQVNLYTEAAKYVLYTYKNTFKQDGKRNLYQGIQECNTTTPISTQKDIDNYLDKVYEFNADELTEGINSYDGSKKWYVAWDGYTDPQFTGGKKYLIRDCIWVAAYDANNNLLAVNCGVNSAVERHVGGVSSAYITAGDTTVSADFYLARNRPVKNFSVLLAYVNCALSNVTYANINKGTEAIIADWNSHDAAVIAYKEFGPLKADGEQEIFHWADIRKINWSDKMWQDLLPAGNFPDSDIPYYRPIPELDGGTFIPDPDYPYYTFIYILETDDMTYTGIMDGFIADATGLKEFPIPKNASTIPSVKSNYQNQFKVTMTPNGYSVACEGAACIKETQVTDILGRVLAKKALPPATKAAQVSVELQPGQIYIVSNIGEDGKFVSVKIIR